MFSLEVLNSCIVQEIMGPLIVALIVCGFLFIHIPFIFIHLKRLNGFCYTFSKPHKKGIKLPRPKKEFVLVEPMIQKYK